MATNLYGPNDNFHPDGSHVIPGLIRRFHEAKLAGPATLTVWGTGTPRREFLHVDDLAVACLFLMDKYDEAGPINVGDHENGVWSSCFGISSSGTRTRSERGWPGWRWISPFFSSIFTI
jgi:nucleoside-diphosphate-sugar epimerase